MDEFLALISDRSAVLRAAAASAPSLDARVPGCPEWTLRDLVAHLGGVQRFWESVVRAGAADGPPPESARGDLTPQGDLLEWSAASTDLLIATLRETSPDQPCWVWWMPSGAPKTAGAVARHQVQEAAVHAWDAEETIGKPTPIPAVISTDAIAEFVEVSLGSEGAWPHAPAQLTLAATEGLAWTIDLTPSGATLLATPPGAVPATVTAPASDLLLALFGRVPPSSLRIDGDAEIFEQMLAWADTQ